MVMTYDKYMDKLYSMMESTICEYDICVLTEEADPNADTAATEKKKLNLWAGFKKLLVQAWEAICKYVDELYRKMTRLQDEAKVTIKYTRKGFDYIFDALDKFAAALITEGADINSELNNVTAKLNNEYQEETVYTVREAKALIAKLNVKARAVDKNVKKAGKSLSSDTVASSKSITGAVRALTTQFAELANKSYDAKKKEVAAAKKAAKKNGATDAGAMGESASKLGRMADLLVEASKVYRAGKSDIADLHLSRILNEASEILLEADDDADDASVIIAADQADIDKGMEIQEPVEDIPEETPADAAEYDPATSGGEGEKIDMEEFKDVIGDDAEAIAIMTDDNGSTVCESVVIDFGI